MGHHKRGKPKSSRSGCLMCKPHKDQAFKDTYEAQTMQEKRARDWEEDQLDYVERYQPTAIAKGKLCEKCKVPSERDECFDAYYCPVCNDWLEQRCANPDCEFCSDRPEKAIVV